MSVGSSPKTFFYNGLAKYLVTWWASAGPIFLRVSLDFLFVSEILSRLQRMIFSPHLWAEESCYKRR